LVIDEFSYNKKYPNQKYKVVFNQKSALFIRVEERDQPEPFWSKENSFMDIWSLSSSFVETRAKLSSERCQSCNKKNNCMNGCPFLEEINLC